MTLESYSTLATKNYNFYAPWNRICRHLVFVNVCLQFCVCLFVAKKLTLEPTSYLAPTTYSNNETVSITC